MPSSRSSSLSRSNILSKASVDADWPYCGTSWRIWAFDMRPAGVEQHEHEVEEPLRLHLRGRGGCAHGLALTRQTLPDGYARDRDAVACRDRARGGAPLAGRGGVRRRARRGCATAPCAPSPTPPWWASRRSASASCSTRPRCSRGSAPAAWPSSWPGPDDLPADPPRRTGPHRQGPLHPDAADAPRRGRAGQPAPPPARRRRGPRRDAGRRRRPALRAPRGARRHPARAPGRAGRLRHDRRRGPSRGVLARGRRAGRRRVARRPPSPSDRPSAATTRP